MADSEKMQGLFEAAIIEVEEVIRGKRIASGTTRHAVSAMGIYARLKSQENSRFSLQHRIIKDLANDKEELREYIKASAPELKITKALKGK